jgi:beta-glucanase (GH16 family)
MKAGIRLLAGMAVVMSLTILGMRPFVSDAAYQKEKGILYSDFNDLSGFQKAYWERLATSEKETSFGLRPANVRLEDDELVLTVKSSDKGLTGGEVYTSKRLGFGLYQASMKPIKNSGVVSAFFNYYNENGKGTEIDIEFLGYDTTKVQFNYYTDGVGGHEYLYDLGFDASEDFHTYSFYWTSDRIIWYVDGVQAYEATASIPQLEAKMHMNAWPGGNTDWVGVYDGTSPLDAYYDWVSYTSIEDMN